MIFKLCISIILPISLAIIIGIIVLSTPPQSTTLTKSLSHPVHIKRDNWGIPHIEAKSIPEAMYGLGYALCQDRMWQIDMMRRISTGRLSEVLGPGGLEVDKFIRNIKFTHHSQFDVSHYNEEEASIADSFSKGINDAAHERWTPIEYYFTNSNWQNFTSADSQSILYLTSFFLSYPNAVKSLKSQLRALGIDDGVLLPHDLSLINPQAFIIDNSELPDELKGPKENLKKTEANDYLNLYSQIFGLGEGSNAWVISGNHTKSGKPILCNDPHMSTSIPSMWYTHHITLPSLSIFGICSVGNPVPGIGRTDRFTWGVTSLCASDIDFYIEKPVNSTHYLFGDENIPFTYFTEEIKIKGQDPLKITYKESIHGPVLENSLLGVTRFLPTFIGHDKNLVSVCTTFGKQPDKSVLFLSRATSIKKIEDFRLALKYNKVIKLAALVASSEGDIMFQAVGLVPFKSYKGEILLNGWIPETKWKGLIDFEEMPYVINPKKGFIVSANNFVSGDQYKYFESLGHNFAVGRADRITSLISEGIRKGHKFTSEDQVELMKDEKDILAEKMIPVLLTKLRVTGIYKEKAEQLGKWDFFMNPDSNLAAIYAKWTVEIAKGLLENKVPQKVLFSAMRSYTYYASISRYFLEGYPSIELICDNPKTHRNETCDDLINSAFINAVDFIGEQVWGDLHQVVLKNMPFSQSSVLKYVYERQMKVGGWFGTVHATSSDWNSSFATVHGPGVKFVADLGDDKRNYWRIESGISGNIFSRHYSDMFQDFHYGDLIKFEYS